MQCRSVSFHSEGDVAARAIVSDVVCRSATPTRRFQHTPSARFWPYSTKIRAIRMLSPRPSSLCNPIGSRRIAVFGSPARRVSQNRAGSRDSIYLCPLGKKNFTMSKILIVTNEEIRRQARVRDNIIDQWFLTFLKTGNTFDYMKNLRNTKINVPRNK